jgi:hypothetical protein
VVESLAEAIDAVMEPGFAGDPDLPGIWAGAQAFQITRQLMCAMAFRRLEWERIAAALMSGQREFYGARRVAHSHSAGQLGRKGVK